MHADPVIVALLTGYLLMTLLISVWAGRRSTSAKDYLTAGRGIGPIVGGASLAATQLSAGTFVGGVGIYYLTGASYIWVMVGYWTGWLLMAFVVAPKFSGFDGQTVPDYVRFRYGSKVAARISAILILTVYLVLLTAQYKAGAAIFHTLLGTSNLAGVLITLAITVLFVVVGGMRATAYTDLMGALLMSLGALATLPIIFGHISAAEVGQINHAIDPVLTGWSFGPKDLIGFGAAFGLSAAVAPYELARLYTMRDVKVVRKAIGWNFLIQGVVLSSVLLIGLSARAIFPNLALPDAASSVMSIEALPPLLGGLLMVGIVSAICTTIAGVMIVATSAVSHDLMPASIRKDDRRTMRITRVCGLVVGSIPVMFALRALDLVQYIIELQAALMASLFFAAIVVGGLWRRATASAAIASMVVGIGVAWGWFLGDNPGGLDPSVPGVGASIIVLALVSLLTSPATHADDAAAAPHRVRG